MARSLACCTFGFIYSEMGKMEDFDSELEKFIEEMDEDQKEIEKKFDEIENLHKWEDLISGLLPISEKFAKNMDSLSSAYALKLEPESHSFLIGTLWAGVLAAYEGFAHDLFDLLLSKETHVNEALKRASTMSKNLKSQIRMKDNLSPSASDLRNLFKTATLHNPSRGVALANHLFDIEIPEVDENSIENALKIRNAYAHNNGGVEVSLPLLEEFHNQIESLVSKFIYSILGQANNKIPPSDVGI